MVFQTSSVHSSQPQYSAAGDTTVGEDAGGEALVDDPPGDFVDLVLSVGALAGAFTVCEAPLLSAGTVAELPLLSVSVTVEDVPDVEGAVPVCELPALMFTVADVPGVAGAVTVSVGEVPGAAGAVTVAVGDVPLVPVIIRTEVGVEGMGGPV